MTALIVILKKYLPCLRTPIHDVTSIQKGWLAPADWLLLSVAYVSPRTLDPFLAVPRATTKSRQIPGTPASV
jgi:putative exporter of polyketide antibiotics